MSANAVLALGFILGLLAGGLIGTLFAWDECQASIDRYKRYCAARDGRRNAKHYRLY